MKILQTLKHVFHRQAEKAKEAVKPPAVKQMEEATRKIRATTERLLSQSQELDPVAQDVPEEKPARRKPRKTEDDSGAFRMAFDK